VGRITNPSYTVGRTANPSYTDAVLTSGLLNLSVGTPGTPKDQQSSANPIDQALALTGTWLAV
jgi:hypothetical protein